MTMTNEGGAPAAEGAGAGEGATEQLLREALGDDKPAAEGGEGQKPENGVPWWQGETLKVSNAKPEGGEGLSDAEWLDNKKFGTFEDMLKAYRGLESQIGREKFVLPKGPEDKAGLDAALKALGKPDAPDAYELKLPEGFDPKLVESYRGIAHEIGLLPQQAQALVEWLEGVDKTTGAENAKAAATELQAEWKDGYKANMELVRRGMTALKLDPSVMNQMAVGYGLANTMRLMAQVGRGLGEAGTIGGDGQGGMGGMSLEQARARKAEIASDPKLRQSLLDGSAPKSLQDEWSRIAEVEAAELERRRG